MIKKIKEFKAKVKLATQGLSFSLICLWLFVGLPLLGLYKLLGLFVILQGKVAYIYNKLDDLIMENKE